MKNESRLQLSLGEHDLRRLLWLLIGLDVFFVVMYLVIFLIAPNISWGPLDYWFDLDEDMSITSWFASMQYVLIGIPVLIHAMQARGKEYVSNRFLWIVGSISMFLAVDEAAGIHEQFSVAAEKLELGWLQILSFKGNHGAWIAIYIVLGIFLIALIYRDLLRIWQSFRKESLYIMAGAVILGLGEVGLEVLSYLFLRTAASGTLYSVEVMVEEALALTGVSIIFYGVCMLLARMGAPRTAENRA